jgi:hypothetical protein
MSGFFEDVRKDFFKLVVLAIPGYIVNAVVEKLGLQYAKEPVLIIAVAVPVIVAVWIAVQILTGRSGFTISRRALVLVFAYSIIFSCVSLSGLFWRRSAVNEPKAPPQTRGPSWVSRLSAWRYAMIQRPEPLPGLLIITTPDPNGRKIDDVRAEIFDLLENTKKAEGIAFDLAFEDSSPAWDRNICSNVTQEVFAVERHATNGDMIEIIPITPTIGDCLNGRLGHAGVVPDRDLVVRGVPMSLPGLPDTKALSWLYANAIAAARKTTVDEPNGGYVEFIAPSKDVPTITLEKAYGDWNITTGRFLLVGSVDHFQTPFGDRLGVRIHADALQGLLTGFYIRRPGWVWTFPVILVSCYIAMAAAVRRQRFRDTLLAGTLSLVVIAVSAVVAMHFWAVWLDLAIPVIAVFLFVLVLWSFTRIRI